jgi:hypothetical protein
MACYKPIDTSPRLFAVGSNNHSLGTTGEDNSICGESAVRSNAGFGCHV